MDEKYLLSGVEVRVQEETKNGYLIQEILEDAEGNEYEGKTYLYEGKLYDDILVEKYAPQIKTLQQQIIELKKERSDIQKEYFLMARKQKDAEALFKNRMEKLAQYDQLECLEAFMEHRITHFVLIHEYDRGPEILTYDEYLKEDDNCGEFKLLTLFGSKKSIKWGVLHHLEHSPSHQAFPATSYDFAVKKLREIIENRFEEIPDICIIESAKRYHISIPDKYLERYKQRAKDNLLGLIENEKKLIAGYEARIVKLETEV